MSNGLHLQAKNRDEISRRETTEVAARGRRLASFALLAGRVVAMALLCFQTSASGSLARGQDPALAKPAVSTSSCWVPYYRCVTPPCYQKCPPMLPCWYYRSTCDQYCPKPIPCVHGCVKFGCDVYQCKPEPCFPAGICPPYGMCRLPPCAAN